MLYAGSPGMITAAERAALMDELECSVLIDTERQVDLGVAVSEDGLAWSRLFDAPIAGITSTPWARQRFSHATFIETGAEYLVFPHGVGRNCAVARTPSIPRPYVDWGIGRCSAPKPD
jgi:hypothetical protein